MQAVRVVARAFVYGTESEDKVVDALRACLGRLDDAEARERITRTRIKGHFGTQILLLETVLRKPRELKAFFERLRSGRELVEALRSEFAQRLDDDRVFHFRLDKQAAVQGRLALGSGGDALNFAIKYEERDRPGAEMFPETGPPRAHASLLDAHKV